VRKLQSAREHLLQSPLGIKADKLLTFAEKGTVTSYRGTEAQNRAFEVSYTAHLIVTDYAGEALDLFFVMADWLHRECPGAKPDALRFHVDILDHKKVDVSLMVDLAETVSVAAVAGGTALTPEPDPDALALALFPGQPA
jgi:hypothetical protein